MNELDSLLFFLLAITFLTIVVHFLLVTTGRQRKKEYRIILAKTVPNNVTSIDLIKNFLFKQKDKQKNEPNKQRF